MQDASQGNAEKRGEPLSPTFDISSITGALAFAYLAGPSRFFTALQSSQCRFRSFHTQDLAVSASRILQFPLNRSCGFFIPHLATIASPILQLSSPRILHPITCVATSYHTILQIASRILRTTLLSSQSSRHTPCNHRITDLAAKILRFSRPGSYNSLSTGLAVLYPTSRNNRITNLTSSHRQRRIAKIDFFVVSTS